MPHKKQIRHSYNLPELDVDLFNKLTDILFEALKENNTACASVLGITYRRWKRWETEPPKWPYWNVILKYVIKEVLSSMNRKGLTQKHRRRLLKAVNELDDSFELEAAITAESYKLTQAETHLRHLLMAGGMFRDEIFKAANSGGFSRGALIRAARTLGVRKDQEGYGKNKRSFWSLPQ